MNNQQPIPLAHITSQLRQLHQEKASGNMTILNQRRQMARINLKDGGIVALSCANKHGVEALQLLRDFDPNWFQFIKCASTSTTDHSLPSTIDILNFLSDNPSSSAPTNNTSIELLSPENLSMLREILTDFMGPVAPMICKKVLRQVQSLESAIDLLANEIPNQQQSLEFKTLAKMKLSLK